MQRLPTAYLPRSLVSIEITHQSNLQSIANMWEVKLKDRRQLHKSDITAFMKYVKETLPADRYLPDHAIFLVREQDEGIARILGTRKTTFYNVFNNNVLRELEIERNQDGITYHIHRQDGSLAGRIEEVSAGQKGLAFLNLLLASGDTPLLVDTPEEGLDNEGVYTELVPVFRREKEKRQIIVVSHNANIPVNADAELIIALEAAGALDSNSEALPWNLLTQLGCTRERVHALIGEKDWDRRIRKVINDRGTALKGTPISEASLDDLIRQIASFRIVCGKIRKMFDEQKNQECIGSIDRLVVKRAVQDIMEGSEHAFKKRGEKYGF